mgnify:CR=1 FL=1
MENEIKELMNIDTDFIKKKLQEEMRDEVIRQIKHSLQDEVREVASKFMEEEISEEIRKMLIKIKPQIIEELQESIIKICAELGKNMVENATNSLSNNWTIKSIVEKLF